MIFVNRRTKNRIILNLVIFGVIGLSAPLVAYYLMIQTISCAPDCIGANLTSRDLQKMNFAKANFVEANMSSANLAGASLREADLSGAKLSLANLRGADLTDAKLIGADLTNADLTGSILNGADFSGANLDNADLTGVDLTETGVSGASFVKANLTTARLGNTNLMGIDFTDAILAGADLQRTRLTGASLSRADLSGATLTEADLTGAWLNLTNLKGVDLSGASLLGSMLIGGQLASANLAGSDLKGTLTVGASFDGANLRGADLRQMRLTATQLLTDELRLDPVLKALNQLQLAGLRVNANLNGVQFDNNTRWPANIPLRGITTTVSTRLPTPVQPSEQSKTAPSASPTPTRSGAVEQLGIAQASALQTTPLTTTQDITSNAALSATSASSAPENDDAPQARHVKMNFFISSLHDIDNQHGTFQADFYLDFFWNQPELADQDIRKVNSAKLFDPFLDAVNAHNTRFLYKAYDNSVEPGTNVRLRTAMTASFSSPVDLRRFPFDQQVLSLKLESSGFDSEHLLFDFAGLPHPIAHSERPYIQTIPKGRYVERSGVSLGWRIQEAKVIQQIHVLPYDNSSWSQVRIDLLMQRDATPYIWKITLVFMFIILLTWSVFWIDGEAVQYRLWLLFMALVITHVFNAVIWRTAPHVPYLTFLDRYLLLCYGSIGWVIASVLVIKRFYTRNYITWARWLNRGLMLLYPTAWVIATVGLFWNVTR